MDPLIKLIVDRIIEVSDPETVILFGSHSRGEANANSDIDLLVVEAQPFGKERSRLVEIGRLDRAVGNIAAPTDILVYSQDEVERFRHAMNHVISRALRDGEVVYARS